MKSALARHDGLLTTGIQQLGGRVIKSRGEGDSLFAVFAHATDALAAACALQQALLAEPWPLETPLRVRMALHTDAAELREGDYYGPGVIRCARLRAVAHGGQVLLSHATSERVRDALPAGASLRDLGSHRLKDLQQPEHVFQLLHPALPRDFPPLRSLETFAHNLPVQLTSFIGREREMAEVQGLLATTHLLTLTGSGGCGKTRLALQIAADLVEAYADGVWLVELAALADPALVPQAVATALGVREEPGRPLTASLTDYLRPKALLLLLDNCEHLLSASAQLAEALLRTCPHLRILASSREGLGIAGERTYPVPSLSLPDPKNLPPLERLTHYEAVRLFVERAVFSQPRFTLTDQNAPATAQVCQRLDGIPLAIELAAARVRALPVEQIAMRLDDRFRLLTGGSRTALPRQQTLRALIDWSYDLLPEPERVLLCRLSVFAGGWALEAAEAVCAGEGIEDWEVLSLLTALVDKSLAIYEEQEGAARYRLLETVRQYSRDRLLAGTREAGRGEAERVRGRHQEWYLRYTEQVERERRKSDPGPSFDRLELEHDNLRAALERSKQEGVDAEAGIRLALALASFWEVRGHWQEGREWLAELLARAGSSLEPAQRAQALFAEGRLAFCQWEHEPAVALLQNSRALFCELGDKRGIAQTLHYEAHVPWNQGDNERATTLGRESLALLRELGDRRGILQALDFLAFVAVEQGDGERATALVEEGRPLAHELGDSRYGHNVLAHVALRQGEYERANRLFEARLIVHRKSGDRVGMGWTLAVMGQIALRQGEVERAARLGEESLAVLRALGRKDGMAEALGVLGTVARRQGDYPSAAAVLGERVALLRELWERRGKPEWEMRTGIAECLEEWGEAARAQGQLERAAQLFASAGALREGANAPAYAGRSEEIEQGTAATRAALGEAAFAAAWAEGRTLTLDQAITFALTEPDADAGAPSGPLWSTGYPPSRSG